MPLRGSASSTPFTSEEVGWFWSYISSSLDRLVETTTGLPIDALDWRPPAAGANSVHVLIVHTIANAEENLLGTLCGHRIERDREEEFSGMAWANGDPASSWPVRRAALERALAEIRSGQLSHSFAHPRRGEVTGQDLLMIVARHAAEHLGQAELTRDLAVAAATAPGEDVSGRA